MSISSEAPIDWPEDTMIGALLKAVTGNVSNDVQPIKANFGILPELNAPIRSKKERAVRQAARALERYERIPSGTADGEQKKNRGIPRSIVIELITA